jgi:hypothetical protein
VTAGSHPTSEQLAEAAARLGWEQPIRPSPAAYDAVRRNHADLFERDDDDAVAAHLYRLAQAEEMLLRYWADRGQRN